MTGLITSRPTRKPFGCGPRGVWLVDEVGRQPYRPPRMPVRWWIPGIGWAPKDGIFNTEKRVENGSVEAAAPIAPEGQTPAAPDSTRWLIVGKRH
jgi:hypothetical protein